MSGGVISGSEVTGNTEGELVFGKSTATPGVTVPLSLSSSGALNIAGNLVSEEYDYISLGYTGSNLTSVIYKIGGSGGTTVATLTLAYSGSSLTSVTKS